MNTPLNPEARYVEAREVAAACGVSVYRLETSFRPDDWACPRDFIDARTRGLLYAVPSLYRLADALQARGAVDAAAVLRAWVHRLPEPAYAPPGEQNQIVAVPPAAAGPDEVDEAVAKLSRRHASDREELPESWARSWEDEHG